MVHTQEHLSNNLQEKLLNLYIAAKSQSLKQCLLHMFEFPHCCVLIWGKLLKQPFSNILLWVGGEE